MALSGKQEELIHVPWSSTEEWLRVYKKIYSGDIVEQTEAHEILLVWKARIPKLPVGVECTLGLIQVCLRDREWTPKIINVQLPCLYENDLRMMYSTAIMKFLNHISNIAHKKQTSLFLIAKQLNVPDWIVDLRHDTAHGHELPSIDVMRVAANVLLTWLHEEYWAAEANNLQTSEFEDTEVVESESEERLSDLIELWTAVNLYIRVKHVYVSDIPDMEMRKTLEDTFVQKPAPNTSNNKTINYRTKLSSVSNILLSELSKNVNKDNIYSKEGKAVIDSIVNNEAFLTNSEILLLFATGKSDVTAVGNSLPRHLIDFWKDILLLLQEKKLLLLLFLELIEVIKHEKDTSRKLIASLWVNTLAQAFDKLKIAKSIYRSLEQELDDGENSFSSKALVEKVREEMDKRYPRMQNVFTLSVNGDFPDCLTDKSFTKKLVLHSNEFSEYYVPEIMKMSSLLGDDANAKDKMLELLRVQSRSMQDQMESENAEGSEKIYTIEDLREVHQKSCTRLNVERAEQLSDFRIRNSKWNIADASWDWSTCPIGALPWQMDGFRIIQSMEPLTVMQSDVRYAIVKSTELPRIVDSNRLKLHSKIQWENLIRKKKQTKRRPKPNKTTVVGRVVENVKATRGQI